MKNLEAKVAEWLFLNSLWGGFLSNPPKNLQFCLIDEELRGAIGQFREPETIKLMNKLVEKNLKLPLITSFLLENIEGGYWAYPNILNFFVQKLLKMDLADHVERVIYPEAANKNYSETIDVKETYVRGFQKISPNEKGISILSGREVTRMPFIYLKFKEIYMVDLVFLSKIRTIDSDELYRNFEHIVADNIPEDSEYQEDIQKATKGMCKIPRAYGENGLLFDDVRKDVWFFKYLQKAKVHKSVKQKLKDGKIKFVQGDVTNLDDLKLIKPQLSGTGSPVTKKLVIPDGSLDFGLAINIDWLIGDWRKALEQVISKLKPKAKIVVAYNPSDAHYLPYGGLWGHLGNIKYLGKVKLLGFEFHRGIVDVLNSHGFESHIYARYPGCYNVSIYAERKQKS